MTRPYDGSGSAEQDPSRVVPQEPPSVSFDKADRPPTGDKADRPPSGDRSSDPGGEAPFDPYRFGAPEHPVPPEYAPPGYQPPAPAPMPGDPAQGRPRPGSPYPPYGYSPPGGHPPSDPPGGYPPSGPPGGYPPAGPPAGPGHPPPGPGYPPGSAGHYPPPPYGGYPSPRTGNGKATAALVLGILSIVFFWTTFFDLLLIIPALVFGVLGLAEARRPGVGGARMARAGLVCTAIGTILAVVFTVFALHRVNHCTDLYGSSGSAYDNCIRHV